ncbi:MAG: alpha/beta hydrolase [Kofleriaceae bacterium]|nr:alpha/beta hydrolase [Kofleriaceae bacterium]
MPGKPRSHIDELRGATRLAVEATRGVTALVEKMHVTIASGPTLLGRPLAIPARLATRAVYASIQGITKLVGSSLDVALAQLAPLIEASPAGTQREIVLAVLNGVLGDYLHETANPLAIEMELRHAGRVVELAGLTAASSKLVVLVHGSCMTDTQFTRAGHDHGAALARDLGYTPLYVRYNSGLHISTNGQALAALLEPLVAAWPVDVDELVLLGHSMGGLVARSACHAADVRGDRWLGRLRAMITLGSPHHGAPLERGGNWIDRLLEVSAYTAPLGALGRIRSAGVTDLRYGNVLDEHWQGRDRFAHGRDPRSACTLPDGVRFYALAGTLSTEHGPRLRSDGMVPVDSALGVHVRPELCLAYPEAHRSIALGTGHIELLGASVYPVLRDWLAT